MKTISFLICIISSTLFDQNEGIKINKLKSGDWTAHLYLTKNDTLPFKLKILTKGKLQFIIYNSEEQIVLKNIVVNRDSIIASFSEYNSKLVFKVGEKELNGYWMNNNKKNYKIPFHAHYGYSTRFKKNTSVSPENCNGKWKIIFDPTLQSEYISLGYFKQKNESINGTFLTETGDFRYLEGNQFGTEFQMSSFDGSHAYLFKAVVKNDSIFGRFLSGNHFEGTWIGNKDENFELTDPYFITKSTSSLPISFKAKKETGEFFIFPSEKYLNKVTIVQIMGTWCPNCLDETRFYKELYDRYHSKGLEIIAVGFEVGENDSISFSKLEKFKKRNNVNFEFILGGTASKKAASNIFPTLDGIKSFPTSIYVGKDGTIQKIHTGFNGPATGIFYEKYVEETNAFIEKLLK